MFSQTHYFFPIAIETFGALGVEADAFLNDLGGRIIGIDQRTALNEIDIDNIKKKNKIK